MSVSPTARTRSGRISAARSQASAAATRAFGLRPAPPCAPTARSRWPSGRWRRCPRRSASRSSTPRASTSSLNASVASWYSRCASSMTTSSKGGSVSRPVSSRAWLTHTRCAASARLRARRQWQPRRWGQWRPRHVAREERSSRARSARAGQLARGAVGQGGEVDVAAPRPADEVGEREGAVAIREGTLLGGDRLVQPAPADVVLAPHQQRPAPAVRQHLGDQGELVRGELALQRLGLGADDDAAPCGGAVERRRQQVGEALAHAGAGLEQADAAAREDVRGGLRELHLPGPPAVAGQARA